MSISAELNQRLQRYQRAEITEHHIYHKLADAVRHDDNAAILRRIGDEERRHYEVWKQYTETDVDPDRFKVWWVSLLGRVLGITFAIRLMEAGEEGAQEEYAALPDQIDEAPQIAEDEHSHEEALIDMLDEERLRYAGSIVLGLNDALVELTGALAGLTLALRDTRLIALSGLITGIAAAMSMAASEYLSTKAEKTEKHPVKASAYTGIAYVFTVAVLIAPYLLLDNYYVCLACTLVAALLIIAAFNFYIAVARAVSFKSRFCEMAGLSLTVAALSFGVGWLVRALLGVDV